MFLLNTLCKGFEGGKCLSMRFRKVLPTFVLTDLLNGGLNQMMFLRLVEFDVGGFKAHGLRITAEISHQAVNFLDITLNLSDGTYAPRMKPNSVPLYINRNSNHPPAIIKQLPKSINKRISSLSANHSLFESTAPVYRDALKRSKYDDINLVPIQMERKHHPHQILLDEEISFGSTPHLVSPSKQTLVKPSYKSHRQTLPSFKPST